MVLSVSLSPACLGEPVVDLVAAATARPFEHSVEHAPVLLVLVESEREEVVQRACGLRNRKAIRVTHMPRKRIWSAGRVLLSVPEE